MLVSPLCETSRVDDNRHWSDRVEGTLVGILARVTDSIVRQWDLIIFFLSELLHRAWDVSSKTASSIERNTGQLQSPGEWRRVKNPMEKAVVTFPRGRSDLIDAMDDEGFGNPVRICNYVFLIPRDVVT
ncbi:hypothetical protein K0M31_018536 [Melipona bicolor]|uniref:Uncharacterized protein n=1 Tax=Melipona bicolor TaxID=60889 RepID=A0AA40KRP7_9HYME|nr:hypothetical protein K0M31_018536 [Melipona bicolor]